MRMAVVRAIQTQARKSSWYGLSVIAIVFICSLLIVLQPIDFLIRHLKDDCFYYLKTANNIALGLGSTFDGINQTNGYHPLWMLNLIPVYWLFPHSPIIALRVVLIITAMYHSAAAFILYCIIARNHGLLLGAFLSLAWALSPFVLRIDLSGMEAALYTLLLTILIYFITTRFKDNQGNWIIPSDHTKDGITLGLLMALCILARLDAIFIFISILLVMSISFITQRRPIRDFSIALMLFIPVALLVGLYLLFNLVTFGHLYPISGIIKRPDISTSISDLIVQLLWPIEPIYRRINSFLFIFITVFTILSTFIVMISYQVRKFIIYVWKRYDWLWFGVIQIYAYMSLSKAFILNWYYVPIILLPTVASADLISLISKDISFQRRARGILLIVSLAFFTVIYSIIASSEFNPHKNDVTYETMHAAQWVKNNLPEGAIGAAWNAGILSYFSGRQIINLDGLVNSYAYYEAMRQGRGPQFVVRQGAKYVFDMYPVPPSNNSSDFFPGDGWRSYLTPYYEYRYYAHNVGISSYFKTVFPHPELDSMFMFKVWRVATQNPPTK